MNLTADTNVIVRAVTGDDARQSKAAQHALERANIVALPIPVLCEVVWVLSQSYGIGAEDIAAALRKLVGGANVALNRPAVEAGLAFLTAGGDFADGVIAYEGRSLGGDTFVSFDKQAIKILKAQGEAAKLLD